MIKKENFSLKELTTFKSGGETRYFFEVSDEGELQEAVFFAKERRLPIHIIGEGSNTLFSDGVFPGVIIRNKILGFEIAEDDNNFLVTCGAGEKWDEIVERTLRANIFGFENLSGIPGSVGATAVSNIGAYGVEISKFVKEVSVLDIENFQTKVFKNEDCQFFYRQSFFKKNRPLSLIIIKVLYVLPKHWEKNVNYKDLQEYFTDKSNLSATKIRKAVIEIRKSKFPDLNLIGTAGSFFMNPIIEKEKANRLKIEFPELPLFDVDMGSYKISLAFILDKICGLKGLRDGNVGLYERQPLVLVNYGGATSKEILDFADFVSKKVFEKTGIEIKPEVMII